MAVGQHQPQRPRRQPQQQGPSQGAKFHSSTEAPRAAASGPWRKVAKTSLFAAALGALAQQGRGFLVEPLVAPALHTRAGSSNAAWATGGDKGKTSGWGTRSGSSTGAGGGSVSSSAVKRCLNCRIGRNGMGGSRSRSRKDGSRGTSSSALSMGLAEGGLGMGFDMTDEVGQRMAAYVDGYQGMTGDASPVLLSVLNHEQLQLLGQMADQTVTGHISTVAERMGHMVTDALAANPVTHAMLETTENVAKVAEDLLRPALHMAEGFFTAIGLPAEMAQMAVGLLAVLGTFTVMQTLTGFFNDECLKQDMENLPRDYDLDALGEFYSRHPLIVLTRTSEVSYMLISFVISLLVDIVSEKWIENMPQRAEQMRILTAQNGPAFIKVGQGASLRPDILPQPYIIEMGKLQDEVPPFSAREARIILERELGDKLENVYADVSVFDKPIAAASLGQVYRATLKSTGESVAVKVQRPGVLFTVTRDLFVMRIILNIISNVGFVRDAALGFRAMIDSWAVRFMDELDYMQEARNAARFASDLSKSEALGEAIIVPGVYGSMTTRYVLSMEWVDGVKVSNLETESPLGKARMATIQATLLNSYLTQLLENGFLHADPHYGNFLVTKDGRLAVLDYGLVCEVTEDQRYALLEYVIHLIAKDYHATLQDLVTLEFVPKEIAEDEDKVALVVPLLATVLEQLSEGGGAQTITIESVGEEVQDLARNYPIAIPPYFGLIIRAFGSLEGLGLAMDPSYSIVKECFPYMCRRLLTEDSPRMRSMLKAFLYGSEGDVLHVDQLDEIIEGYRAFTALAAEASRKDGNILMMDTFESEAFAGRSSGSSSDSQQGLNHSGGNNNRPSDLTAAGAGTRAGIRSRLRGFLPRPGVSMSAAFDPTADPVAAEAIKLLFAKEGNYVQDLVVEEMARMTDALGRELNLEIAHAMRKVTDRIADPPIPMLSLRPSADRPPNLLMLPLQLPFMMVYRMVSTYEKTMALNNEDKEALRALRRLLKILMNASDSGPANPLTKGATAHEARLALIADEVEDEFVANRGILSSVMSSPGDVLRGARRLRPVLPLMAPGAGTIGKKFARRLAGRTLHRIAEGVVMDGTEAYEKRDSQQLLLEGKVLDDPSSTPGHSGGNNKS